MEKQKVLVIHLDDKSTEMLKYVYEGKDYTVITNPDILEKDLITALKEHDKIIFLGHGTRDGLINPHHMNNRYDPKLYLITHRHVQYFKDKETVSVWCFSDKFFATHNLHGFHTGMIISERPEANYMLNECPLTDAALYENMVNFSRIVGDVIEEDPETMKQYLLEKYIGDDKITNFNRKNIIVL